MQAKRRINLISLEGVPQCEQELIPRHACLEISLNLLKQLEKLLRNAANGKFEQRMELEQLTEALKDVMFGKTTS